jgi:hypothetical protein
MIIKTLKNLNNLFQSIVLIVNVIYKMLFFLNNLIKLCKNYQLNPLPTQSIKYQKNKIMTKIKENNLQKYIITPNTTKIKIP